MRQAPSTRGSTPHLATQPMFPVPAPRGRCLTGRPLRSTQHNKMSHAVERARDGCEADGWIPVGAAVRWGRVQGRLPAPVHPHCTVSVPPNSRGGSVQWVTISGFFLRCVGVCVWLIVVRRTKPLWTHPAWPWADPAASSTRHAARAPLDSAMLRGGTRPEGIGVRERDVIEIPLRFPIFSTRCLRGTVRH